MRRLAFLIASAVIATPAFAQFDPSGFSTAAFDSNAFEFGDTDDISVPDVLGMTEAEADAAIEAVGLDVGVVTSVCSAATAGDVVSQVPPSGALVSEGSLVNLTLSSGMPCIGAGGKLKLRLDLRL